VPAGNARVVWWPWALAILKVGVHLALSNRYGYHRDELYFIECGRHLAFGYVDHAPLVPWIAALAGALGDHSLLALRLLPALAGGATVLLSGRLAARLGGGRLAVLLACVATLVPPAYLRMGKILCIPVFEPFFWTLASLLVVRILQGESRKLWLAAGLVAGVGLLNKHSMLLWIAGLAVGMLATPARRELRAPWPWLGLAIALALWSPNLVWQARHDWATVEFLRNLSTGVLAGIPRSLFLLGQVLYMHPCTLPVWIAGLVFLFSQQGRTYRLFGWSYLVVMGVLLATHAKPYYAAPLYPLLFACGAVAIEARWGERASAMRAALGTLAIGGVAFASISLPILAVDRIDALLGAVLGRVVRPEELTRELHDEYGWREQVDTVASVHAALAPHERDAALVLTANYGQASAINFFGRERGLPRAVSGHVSYHLWGIEEPDRGAVAIAYGMPRARLDELYGDVREAARIQGALAMPEERDLPVYVCRDPRVPLAVAWPSLRRYAHGRGAGAVASR
jgi:hypothetical protein